jgi:hypothetical protein
LRLADAEQALADGRALAGRDRESLLAAVSALSSRYNPLRRRLER